MNPRNPKRTRQMVVPKRTGLLEILYNNNRYITIMLVCGNIHLLLNRIFSFVDHTPRPSPSEAIATSAVMTRLKTIILASGKDLVF